MHTTALDEHVTLRAEQARGHQPVDVALADHEALASTHVLDQEHVVTPRDTHFDHVLGGLELGRVRQRRTGQRCEAFVVSQVPVVHLQRLHDRLSSS